MDVQITSFEEKYWPQLQKLIDEHWESGHPVTDPKLFFWQYKGFGELDDYSAFKLLFVDGKLEGFRGVIPGIYQVNLSSKKQKLEPGISFAMWLVTKKYRGQGLGYKLLLESEKMCNIAVTLGTNINTSYPIYIRNNYNTLDALNRYVVPLEATGYAKLLNEGVSKNEIKIWIKRINLSNPIRPIKPNLINLQNLWDNSNKDVNLFSLYRNEEFWKWRYLDSPGYKYLFFGDPSYGGIVVARIEQVYSPKNKDTDKLKVLRIIEIVPYESKVWNGSNLDNIEEILNGVLAWAYEQGCCAADFQCSTKRLEKLLYNVGFKFQDKNYKPDICSLAGVFEPLVYKPSLVNAHWKVKGDKNDIISIDSYNTYFVKSDNDRDRPAIWPLPNRYEKKE